MKENLTGILPACDMLSTLKLKKKLSSFTEVLKLEEQNISCKSFSYILVLLEV